jgi:uncharacterized protein (TIGR02246 family)
MAIDNDFVVAECAIRQLHARCADAVWRKDYQAFASCFAADGEWKIAGLHMRGRAEIGSKLETLLSTSDKVLMLPGTPILEVAHGTASGRIHVSEYCRLKDGHTARTLGIYYDRYVRAADHWLFQWRHWTLIYRGPPDFSVAFQNTADFGPPPGLPGADEPTTVRKSS